MPARLRQQLTVQGVIYIVTAITAKAIELQMRPEYCREEDDEQTGMALADACTQLRLCHTQCYLHVGDDEAETLFGGDRVVRPRRG